MTALLSVALLQPIEFLINRLAARDSHILATLADPERDKSVSLCGTSMPAWQITVLITPTRIMLLSAPDQQADAEIQGSTAAFLQLLLHDDPATALHHPDIILSGDISLIQHLYRGLRTLDVRWDDLLAPWLGDVNTHALQTASTQAAANLGRAMHTLKLDLTDYLQEEAAVLPKRDEIEELTDALQSMRLRLDRLDARVRRLNSINDAENL